MDRGDWWATVHRVEKNWTQLKRLSTHTCHVNHTNRHFRTIVRDPQAIRVE